MRKLSLLASNLVIGLILLSCNPTSDCSQIGLAISYLEENAFKQLDFFKNSTISYNIAPLYEDKIQMLGASMCETIDTTGRANLTKIPRDWLIGEEVNFLVPNGCLQKSKNLILDEEVQIIETSAGTYVSSNEHLVLLKFAKSDPCGRQSSILFYLIIENDIVSDWCYNPLVDNNFDSDCD